MEIVNGIARAIVPAITAYAVGKGWITESAAAEIGAALVTLAAAVWSVVAKRKAA